ncbi:MAG TPA: DUF3662 and FHA domain-containing protein [Dehalococcoidia bacterium]|nr:DUF3662 and FHA domain-containing protein [Dehalococcoidia bacterium]
MSRFEQAIERLIEGSAFRFFGGDLQPIEIAKRVARVMESERLIAPYGAIAPNQYDVSLAPADYDRLARRRISLEREIEDYLIQSAARRGIRLDRRPVVRIGSADHLRRHQVAVEAGFVDPVDVHADEAEPGLTSRFRVPPRPAHSGPALRLIDPAAAGEIAVAHLPFSIGRGLDNDLTVPDRRVSRNHALIREIEGRLCLVDLESTNGTFINGRAVRQGVLSDADTISLGGYSLRVALNGGP